MELITDLREGLEQVCTKAAENLRRYNDFEVKLRQACKELDDEKVHSIANILCMDFESMSLILSFESTTQI